MGTSVLHIKTEVECHVYFFDEEKGIAKPGIYFNLEVRKGEQDLLFVSTEDEGVICFMSYIVEEGDHDYKLFLEQSQFINVNSQVTEEEISSGVIDEFGVVYSRDRLQLLKCQNKEIKDYHIKAGCKVIRRGAFHLCMNLTVITLPDSLMYIGDGAFWGCTSLVDITLPDNLTHIGDRAFTFCNSLVDITLPANLIHIGYGAFFCYSQNLITITLPANLTHIRDAAFSGTGIRNVVSYSPNFTFSDGCLIDQLNHRLIAYLSDKEQVSLPSGLTHIGDYAFEHCINLTAITLPNTLLHIGNNAFQHCFKLTSITFPDGLKYIGDNAFSKCKNLREFTLPNSLTHIGHHVFDDCNLHIDKRACGEQRHGKVSCEVSCSYGYEYGSHYGYYEGSYAHDYAGFSDDVIDDAFEGDPDAYWNID